MEIKQRSAEKEIPGFKHHSPERVTLIISTVHLLLKFKTLNESPNI